MGNSQVLRQFFPLTVEGSFEESLLCSCTGSQKVTLSPLIADTHSPSQSNVQKLAKTERTEVIITQGNPLANINHRISPSRAFGLGKITHMPGLGAFEQVSRFYELYVSIRIPS